MSSVAELLNIENKELTKKFIQDVELRCTGIDGLIAYFNFTYKGNDFQVYAKDEQAYLRIDYKDPNYKETIVIVNRTTGKIYDYTVLYDAPIPRIDLDTLIEEEYGIEHTLEKAIKQEIKNMDDAIPTYIKVSEDTEVVLESVSTYEQTYVLKATYRAVIEESNTDITVTIDYDQVTDSYLEELV